MSNLDSNRDMDFDSCRSRRLTSAGCQRYLQLVWVDLLCIGLVALLSCGIYWTPVYLSSHRLLLVWPSAVENITGADLGFRAPMEVQYPFQKAPLSSGACGLIIVLVPLIVIALFQFRTRSLWDFHTGASGILKAAVTTGSVPFLLTSAGLHRALVCTILKHFIGGFRPHFIDVCKPNMTLLGEEIEQQTFFMNTTICTGDRHQTKKALESFPSGHTASSFASAMFLAFYMNAKLKTIGDHASQCWTIIVTITPLIGASLVGGSMYVSHQHHAHDIVFGMIIGVIFGTLAYRSSYAAIFDSRYNHIPLPPFAAHTRFSYSLGKGSGFVEALEGKNKEETDHLVVWSWWNSVQRASHRDKERVWLRAIRNVRGCEISEMCIQGLPKEEQEINTRQRIESRLRGAARGSYES